MKSPLVSVCLPNLNTFPYLEERVDTIFAQTYDNWELVVSDNFSEDGAWPFFEKLARRDARVRISQAPREGLYPNWNNCIRAAQGEYVYIATSDDTMATDCLEKLVGAMESHPECDLAHCQLRMIDPQGKIQEDGVSPNSIFALSSGDRLFQRHVRRAPFDGLLHMLGTIVYFSITQLLIRRSLFDKVGLFESRWGSIGDFNWEMRAGLVANTIHVPDTWGGFRVHPLQATARWNFASPEFFTKLEEMIDDALSRSPNLAGCAAKSARDPRLVERCAGSSRILDRDGCPSQFSATPAAHSRAHRTRLIGRQETCACPVIRQVPLCVCRALASRRMALWAGD